MAVQPCTNNNGVHVSASPVESLRERMIWLDVKLGQDELGSALSLAGVPGAIMKEWMENPIVTWQLKRHSLFDLFEDVDTDQAVDLAAAICKDNVATLHTPFLDGLPNLWTGDESTRGPQDGLASFASEGHRGRSMLDGLPAYASEGTGVRRASLSNNRGAMRGSLGSAAAND